MGKEPKATLGNERTIAIIKAYPVALLIVAVLLNTFVFGVNTILITLPSDESIRALIIAATILVINHTWIMNSTELTRARFGLHSTPEEWEASGTVRSNAATEGLDELERYHNIHRNTTENTVYYVLLALIFVSTSPTKWAAQVWLVGYAVARLGYTYSYLTRKDDVRGIFMSLSLVAIFGMTSYLVIGLVIS